MTTAVTYSDGIASPPPRAHPRGAELARIARLRAASATCLVRDEGADGIGAFLDRLDRQDLYALVTVLAAMVPDDCPMDDLLAWVDPALSVVA